MAVDRAAAERAVAAFLEALGRSPTSDPELAGTPARVTEAFADDLLAGYAVDVPALLAEGSATDAAASGIVVVRDVAVATMCPHHLLPALGRATLAYQPGPRLLGIGTLAALADACSRRLVVQEQIGETIVRALVDHAGARGAWCRLELVHGCLSARGTRQASASVVTVAAAGTLAEQAAAPELALALGEAPR